MNDLLRLLAWPPTFRPTGADVSAVQSVEPWTSREEIRDLYHQVYKLRRMLRSLPLCGPEQAGELMRDVVSSLKNCLRQKEDELLRGQGRVRTC